MTVKIRNVGLDQEVEVTLSNYHQVFSAWLCDIMFDLEQVQSNERKKQIRNNLQQKVLILEVEAFKLNSNNVVVLYVLLKLFQINNYNQIFMLTIKDTKNAVIERYKTYNKDQINISWLWCHIGLYAMHIGYNVCCNNTQIGINYLCQEMLEFYYYTSYDDIKYQFVMQDIDKYLVSLEKEAQLLFIMRVGVTELELLSLTQILPIFQFDLKRKKEGAVLTKRIVNTEQYNSYLDSIQQFQDNFILPSDDQKTNPFIATNNFLIPFHVLQLDKEFHNVCVQILIDQSHAFKTCYMVLNFIFHQCAMTDVQNTNYVLADGSQCGKTTFDLSLYYALMFHQDLKQAPIMVQRQEKASGQPLIELNSVVISDVDNLCQNFQKIITKIDLKAQIISEFAKIVEAGLLDAYSYPGIIREIAAKLFKASIQAQIAKTIIHKLIYSEFHQSQIYSEYYKDMFYQVKIIEQHYIVQSMKHIINVINKPLLFDQQILNRFLTQSTSVLSLFQLIGQLNEKIINEFTENVYIFDEVCYKNINLNPKTYDYCKLLTLIQNLMCEPKDIALQETKKYLKEQMKDGGSLADLFDNTQQTANNSQQIKNEKQGFLALIQEIDKIEQLALLVFPLTMFLKTNFKDELDTILSYITNLRVNSGTCNQIKGIEFLIELASVQAFEAIMYRDLNYVLYKTNKATNGYTFNKDLITSFLIESILHKNIQENNQQDKLKSPVKSQFLKYQIDVEYFSSNYKSNDITFFLSGTFCSLTNFVRYTDMLLASSSSRVFVTRSIHSCPTSSPQFHACKLQNKYYIQGIDSETYKDPVKYFGTFYKNNLESNLINLFYAMNPYMSGFIQSLYAQVSPQLIIINPKTNMIIYSKSHLTYCEITNNDKILCKVRAQNMNHQLSIQKIIMRVKDKENNITEQNISFKQQIQVYYSALKFSTDNHLQLNLQDGHDALQMQPLSQSNITQLAIMGNYMIELFHELLNDEPIDRLQKLLIDYASFFGKASNLNESLFLIHYLFTLKYGIKSDSVKNITLLLSQTIPKLITRQDSYVYGVFHDSSPESSLQVLDIELKVPKCTENEIFITFLAPELVQLEKYTEYDQLEFLEQQLRQNLNEIQYANNRLNQINQILERIVMLQKQNDDLNQNEYIQTLNDFLIKETNNQQFLIDKQQNILEQALSQKISLTLMSKQITEQLDKICQQNLDLRMQANTLIQSANQKLYESYLDKQIDMTKIAANSIFQLKQNLKVVIIAVKFDDSKVLRYFEQKCTQSKTPQYLITFHFQNGGENSFDTSMLNRHSSSNTENILMNLMKSFSTFCEIVPYKQNENQGKHVCTMQSVQTSKNVKNDKKQFIIENRASFLKFVKNNQCSKTILSKVPIKNTFGIEDDNKNGKNKNKEAIVITFTDIKEIKPKIEIIFE
ncbi:Conserved_hypothetical protein [Hexamita inflata]|uniref:Uncharacterized protein n=1 Tax=Hexamita inflata TaxID=28002 RepID=A0ABP1GU61_9EUKA